MSTTINAAFDTRRDAELAVEHLVQELGVERSDIFIAAEGDSNSAGILRDGSDKASAGPSPEEREDAALKGAVLVSVDVNDERIEERIAGIVEGLGGNLQETN